MIQYNPDWQQPGDPLYLSPREQLEGDVAMQGVSVPRWMAEVLPIRLAEECDCGVSARWPEPFDDEYIRPIYVDDRVLK